VNSICHFFGRRPFAAGDRSTNNWVLALPSLGEAWHHNHHVFPTSAFHGLGWRQIDLSGLVIATCAGRAPSRSAASAPQPWARRLRLSRSQGGISCRVVGSSSGWSPPPPW